MRGMMKLKKFKKIIDKAVKYADCTNPKIFFYTKEQDLKIKRINQSSLMANFSIHLKKVK
jgi:hypothetical protein